MVVAPNDTALDRLLAKVEIDDVTGCWIWTGARSPTGYGRIRGGDGSSGAWLVHRLAYTLLVGPIPDDLTIDHLCRVRACCNPDHLEPVPHRENVLRGEGITAREARLTECIHGHPFDEANTYHYKGQRHCKTCRRERLRAWRRRPAK